MFNVELTSCTCHLNKSHYLYIFDRIQAQRRGLGASEGVNVLPVFQSDTEMATSVS